MTDREKYWGLVAALVIAIGQTLAAVYPVVQGAPTCPS